MTAKLNGGLMRALAVGWPFRLVTLMPDTTLPTDSAP